MPRPELTELSDLSPASAFDPRPIHTIYSHKVGPSGTPFHASESTKQLMNHDPLHTVWTGAGQALTVLGCWVEVRRWGGYRHV